MDDDEFLELFFGTWEPPELPESEIDIPQPVDPDYWHNDWFPMD